MSLNNVSAKKAVPAAQPRILPRRGLHRVRILLLPPNLYLIAATRREQVLQRRWICRAGEGVYRVGRFRRHWIRGRARLG